MSKYTYYSQEGLDKLIAELKELKTKGRADISREIAEARDKGDLSENAEYDAAKDAQGHLEARIAKLEELVSKARVFESSQIDASVVSVLTTVTIKNLKNNLEVKYSIVAENEADLTQRKISINSPFGKGLIGKKVGETAVINAPAGEMTFEIMDISAMPL